MIQRIFNLTDEFVYEWIGVATTICSLFFLSEKLLQTGFIFGILSSIAWTIYAMEIRARGLLILQAILFILNIKGLLTV